MVVGSGAAGASAALEAAGAGRSVLVVTKGNLGSGSTELGAGWVGCGAGCWRRLRLGPREGHVDCRRGTQRPNGWSMILSGKRLRRCAICSRWVPSSTETPMVALQLAREGGHGRPRIVHAGGDATGAEVQRTLDAALRRSTVTVWERCVALDAVLDAAGQVAGVVVAARGSRQVRWKTSRWSAFDCAGRRDRGHWSGIREHHQPTGSDRRRHRVGTAGRSGGGRRRVRAVPPDRVLAAGWLPRSTAAGF